MVYNVTYDKCINCFFSFITCGFCSCYLFNTCKDHTEIEKSIVPICRLCFALHVLKDMLEMLTTFPDDLFKRLIHKHDINLDIFFKCEKCTKHFYLVCNYSSADFYLKKPLCFPSRFYCKIRQKLEYLAVEDKVEVDICSQLKKSLYVPF